MTLEKLLEYGTKKGASDLHLLAGYKPSFRIDGKIEVAEHFELFEHNTTNVFSILSSSQIQQFEAKKELDLAFSFENLGTFRANFYMQKTHLP